MTIKLLAQYGRAPAGSIVTLDSATETSLIGGKQATSDLTGGSLWTDPYAVAASPKSNLAVDPFGIGSAGSSVIVSPLQAKKAPQPMLGGPSLSLADITVVGGSPTVSVTTGPNGQPALKLVTGVGVAAEFSVNALVGKAFYGDAFVVAHGDRSSGFDYFTWYVGDGTSGGYGNGWTGLLQYGLTNPSSSTFEQGGANTYHFRKAALSQINVGPGYPMPIAAQKLRVTPLAGQSATVFIYAIGIAAPARKGRICVSTDDGYESYFGLLHECFGSRGIRTTAAIIGSVQGTGNGYSNINQLRAYVDAGNAVVAHGPWPSDAASQVSNIVDLYASAKDPVGSAVADASAARQWILDQGLATRYFDRCYVWPQGKFQAYSGDLRYLDAMMAAGFTCCRNVGNVVGSAQPASFNFDALSKYNRMALPIIGHTWAGTTALEATNITNITNAIAALAANRTDAFLMLHRGMPSNTNDAGMGAAGNITLRQSDCETIAAAIKTQIDAGTLEDVTMPELAASTWWRQF